LQKINQEVIGAVISLKWTLIAIVKTKNGVDLKAMKVAKERLKDLLLEIK
jgi:hypothetical protein